MLLLGSHSWPRAPCVSCPLLRATSGASVKGQGTIMTGGGWRPPEQMGQIEKARAYFEYKIPIEFISTKGKFGSVDLLSGMISVHSVSFSVEWA